MTAGTHLLAGHERLAAALPGAGAVWLDRLRRDGARRFDGLGLPHRKVEDWRYTDLGVLARHRFSPRATAPAAARADLPAPLLPEASRAVFVNGRFASHLSDLDRLPRGVAPRPLAEVLSRAPHLVEDRLARIAAPGEKPLVALNTAWLADGIVLEVEPGRTLDRPLEVLMWSAAADDDDTDGSPRPAWYPRHLLVLNPGSRAVVVERHGGPGGRYLANGVAEILCREGATLRHYRLQDEPAEAVHIATTEVRLEAGAGYDSFVLSTGAALARNQIAVELAGEGARCRLDGAYLVRGTQHSDTSTLIDHAAPGCTSSETYRGVLDDRGRGVFQGRILVRRDAQGSDGHQSNKALLLSSRAEIDAKPELEIHADDVRCGHGATAGELDDDALFYLRARGLPESEARGLLIDAFLGGVLDEIRCAATREAFRRHAAAWRGGGER